MNFLYGNNDTFIDVTSIVLSKCIKSNVVYLPKDDYTRASLFTDPLVGILKIIKIIKNDNEIILDNESHAFIDMNTEEIYNNNIPEYIKQLYPNELNQHSIQELNQSLRSIHQGLKFKYGSLYDEVPEQLMALRFLTGHEKVLEIGANIGRNTVLIQSILNKKYNTQFVTLECDPISAARLEENRDLNNMSFQIENSALSKRKLIQKEWDTIVSDVVLDGYVAVNTITWEELRKKYSIEFDTLVLDCEGAFFYILQDMSNMLEHINMILMENDYHNIDHKEYVDYILKQNGFTCVYQEAGGWGPCYSRFFETWKKL